MSLPNKPEKPDPWVQAGENLQGILDAEKDGLAAPQRPTTSAPAEVDSSELSSEHDDKPGGNDTSGLGDTSTMLQVTSGGEQHLRAMEARRWVTQRVPKYLNPNKGPFAKRLQRAIPLTNKFIPDISNVKAKDRDGLIDLTVRIWRRDTLDAADILRKRHSGDKIAVLNHANPAVPGGGLLNGSIAQEEALCMRSTLYQTLGQRLYPLKIPFVIYSPDVLVCKAFNNTWSGKTIGAGGEWFVDVISAAAIAGPKLIKDPRTGLMIYADPNDRNTMREGILSILFAAVENEVKRLVLGAWGCGAFRNPIHEVAWMMREIILGLPGGLPPHNWAALGLVEIVIAIHDQDSRRGYPVWNGFLNQFRNRGPLPLEMQSFETTEICHVLRWSEKDLSFSLNSSSFPSPARHDDSGDDNNDDDTFDSLFDDSENEGNAGPAVATGTDQNQLATQAAGILKQITGLAHQDASVELGDAVVAQEYPNPGVAGSVGASINLQDYRSS